MDGMRWEECCQQAVAALADIPMCLELMKMARTVQSWFSEFKTNGRKFIVPSVLYKHKHNNIPEFLQVYPDLKETIIKFCDNNIGDFNLNTMHLYINKCINIISQHDALFGCDKDEDTCSEEESQSSSDESNKSLRKKIQEAAEDVTYQRVATKKEEKKKECKLILKGLLVVPPNNGSSRADDTCSEGTIEGYPIVLDGE
eukprot:14643097-Ditylum_brightwellii.AAC.1